MSDAGERRTLEGLFPPTLTYALEKMSQAARGELPFGVGEWGVEQVRQLMTAFRNVPWPYGDAGDREAVSALLDELEYPAAELLTFFQAEVAPRRRDDAAIFAWFVQDRCDALLEMAREIDNQYRNRHCGNGASGATAP
jgi:hypothetical protein